MSLRHELRLSAHRERVSSMKRKFIAIFIIIAMLSAVLCGCGDKAAEQTEYIGIISAMENEMDILLKEAEIDRVDTVAGVEFHVGTLRGQPVVITLAGIGKIRTASGVTAMFEKYPISKVIFTGIAGGVADDAQVLDEVVATRLLEHDYGIITNDGFEWRSGNPGFGDESGEYYYCDEQLVDLAYEASVQVIGKEHTHKGTIATGDQFVASEEYVKSLKENYDAYACEMEGAAVAVVCAKYEKPFVIIRALSDKADGNAHESYGNFGDIAASNSGTIVLNMLESIGKQAG